MVAATFVPQVRRSIPRVVEVFLWIAAVAPARRPVVVADPVINLNRRLAAAGAVAGTAALTRVLDASIWFRDVMLPRQAQRLTQAAKSGRVESRARLESLREASA